MVTRRKAEANRGIIERIEKRNIWKTLPMNLLPLDRLHKLTVILFLVNKCCLLLPHVDEMGLK